ncbi:hypothetical protein [Actinomadura napierensis]|uniref:Uncharacterized protein n=1 Tax=Actinomadura napierensis TaxID=267854 RepID=A0ABN3AHC2_9ACTN
MTAGPDVAVAGQIVRDLEDTPPPVLLTVSDIAAAGPAPASKRVAPDPPGVP